ncbi:MAG: EAL domain-containing protein, partial [Oscillospiraceae bacterium]
MNETMMLNYAFAIDRIISGEYIYPVFQPIVSLKDGSILGYEALSRVCPESGDACVQIDMLFNLAITCNKLWELETLCRKKTLEAAAQIGDLKLFLNVNPNIIHDEVFKKGFTYEYLNKYGINAQNVIFEITERTAVNDLKTFKDAIGHYKGQGYQVAIDDMGAGYSGYNMIIETNPQYLKIDMNIVRNIDKDDIKRYLIKSLVQFSGNAGIKLIAEGIETSDELCTLIKLGVEYGQGFYLDVPSKELR